MYICKLCNIYVQNDVDFYEVQFYFDSFVRKRDDMYWEQMLHWDNLNRNYLEMGTAIVIELLEETFDYQKFPL